VGTDTHVADGAGARGPGPDPRPPIAVQRYPRRPRSAPTSSSITRRRAVMGSTASNTPAHVPTAGALSDTAVQQGHRQCRAGATVLFNNKAGPARNGDAAG